jgi:fatty acid kinase
MGGTPRQLDARALREAMSRFLEALAIHREEIDSLNVFPVPDGDTGSNLLFTQRAVGEALQELNDPPLSQVAETVARSARMGARGNSGMILSQALQGLCSRLSSAEEVSGGDLAEALGEAAKEAHRAVAKPVEGTMLSVLRYAAAGARAAALAGEQSAGVAEFALVTARDALARTPEELGVLKARGVVDAGGKGIVLLLDALASVLARRPLSEEVGP